MNLVEMTDEEKKEAILQEIKNVVMLKAGIPTKNGHTYSKEILEDIAAAFNKFELFGAVQFIYSLDEAQLLDTPDMGDMGKICGCVDSLRVETKVLEDGTEECALVGDIKILNTPNGKLVDYVITNGTNIYIIPFGRGTTSVTLSGSRQATVNIEAYELLGFKTSLFAPQ